jgi:hypothetical protein
LWCGLLIRRHEGLVWKRWRLFYRLPKHIDETVPALGGGERLISLSRDGNVSALATNYDCGSLSTTRTQTW